MVALQQWVEKIKEKIISWDWKTWLETPETPSEKRTKTLVNKNYYDAIERKLSNLSNPTVENAIHVMRNQGNTAYVKAFPYIKKHEKKFEKNQEEHEIVHLSARIGHAPFQEKLQLAFQMGMDTGCAIMHAGPDELNTFQLMMDANKEQYASIIKEYYQDESLPEMSQRDTAIYFAAGLYLRNKLDCYCAANLKYKSYATQKEYCLQLAQNDQVREPYIKNRYLPDFVDALEHKMNTVLKAPYALITLSKPEWRAIEAVALGMGEPEQTPYPKRMASIKQSLVNTGLFFDRPSYQEKLALKQKEEQNSETRDKGQTL